MIHIPTRKPREVITEQGLHPNPGPRRQEPPEEKRRRCTRADEEETQKHAALNGSSPSYANFAPRDSGKRGSAEGSQREEV